MNITSSHRFVNTAHIRSLITYIIIIYASPAHYHDIATTRYYFVAITTVALPIFHITHDTPTAANTLPIYYVIRSASLTIEPHHYIRSSAFINTRHAYHMDHHDSNTVTGIIIHICH